MTNIINNATYKTHKEGLQLIPKASHKSRYTLAINTPQMLDKYLQQLR